MRRDWSTPVLFMGFLGAVVVVVPIMALMLGEPTRTPTWPFFLGAAACFAVSGWFAYLSWKGRSPLTYKEREFVRQVIETHIENLAYMDSVYDKALESPEGTNIAAELTDEKERNARSRRLAQDVLNKVDQLL